MNNNVVLVICDALAERSIAAFRFNFRGVGASQGSFGEGIGEQEDLKAALALMASEPRVKRDALGIAGYSFGCTVAVPVASQVSGVRALALVSPPLQGAGLIPLKSFARPKLVLCGDQDFVVSVDALEGQLKDLPRPVEWHIVPGVDHFWWGQERLLSDKIGVFFSRALCGSGHVPGPETTR
ncbi:MAG: dienelactone hydrolase family protein [Chloroflexi bacterium]|nr:dienelactone hydrolase family protein [Chloroflexota bacterium]